MNEIELNYEYIIKQQFFNEENEDFISYRVNLTNDIENIYLGVPKNEEQALIGSKIIFTQNNENEIKWKIIGYKEMKDLTIIPERFHILFNSDWNKGNNSTMTSTNRSDINNLYLEYNKWVIQQAINSNKPQEEEINMGFIKD